MSEVKSPFDFLNDINLKKEYLYSDASKSKYEPYLINRGMSQHSDTIFYANEMNKNPHLNKELQHDFYFYIIDKRKRYGKWAKADHEHDEMIGLIVKEFGVNRTHAKGYFDLMDDETLTELKKRHDVGGRK